MSVSHSKGKSDGLARGQGFELRGEYLNQAHSIDWALELKALPRADSSKRPILSLSELRIAPTAAQTGVKQVLRSCEQSCIRGRSSARQRSGGAFKADRVWRTPRIRGAHGGQSQEGKKHAKEVCGGVRGAQRWAEGAPQRAEYLLSTGPRVFLLRSLQRKPGARSAGRARAVRPHRGLSSVLSRDLMASFCRGGEVS